MEKCKELAPGYELAAAEKPDRWRYIGHTAKDQGVGQTSKQYTRKVYPHVTKEAKEEAAHKFGELMRSPI